MKTAMTGTMLEDRLDYEERSSCGTRERRVLLGEDDREMRSLLTWALMEEGYEVVGAADGLELMSYLEPRFLDARMHGRLVDVDLVLSDLRMPGLSGMDILSRLRQHDRETPFILITAFGDQLTHAQARDLGASLVLDKPFDVDEVLAVIRRILPPR